MPNTLGNGEWLKVGESLWSENGETEFKMQQDGKIALYVNARCEWQNTSEQRYDVKGLHMQEDGNLVLYDQNDNALWHSNTAPSNGPVILAVQNDGNLVLYRGDAVWASNTGR